MANDKLFVVDLSIKRCRDILIKGVMIIEQGGFRVLGDIKSLSWVFKCFESVS